MLKISSEGYGFAITLTIVGVILMSVESLLIRLANISGLTYSFYLGILMFISIGIILLKDGITSINITKKDFKIILMASIFTALANIFFINAIKHTTIANTVVIISSSPLFTSLFAYLFYKEKVQKNIFIASFFIFIGLFIIFSSHLQSGNMFGDILALLCTISFSLTFTLMSRHNEINRYVVLAFTGIAISVMASFFVKSYEVDVTSIYILLLAGLLITPLSRVFILIGTKSLPASEVSLFVILETILAPIWAWIFLSEVPSLNTIIGGGVILATLVINTLYLMQVAKKRRL